MRKRVIIHHADAAVSIATLDERGILQTDLKAEAGDRLEVVGVERSDYVVPEKCPNCHRGRLQFNPLSIWCLACHWAVNRQPEHKGK